MFSRCDLTCSPDQYAFVRILNTTADGEMFFERAFTKILENFSEDRKSQILLLAFSEFFAQISPCKKMKFLKFDFVKNCLCRSSEKD